ncbi:MAG: UvrD-helicase domain-containing protein [Thermodesulfobacteriota bacterium]
MPELKDLNAMQIEAAVFKDGPLLVVAGAGSGKTKLLTSRIAHLVRKRNVPADRITAVTFTNKAAEEIKERLRRLLGTAADSLWLGTFHSLGLKILKLEGHVIGLQSNLTVYDDDDQLKLVRLAMADLSISEKAFQPKAILARIDQAKNEHISPEEYAESHKGFFEERVSLIYSLYQKKLREMNALDFGDLICVPLALFKKHPGVLERYRERFLHVLVDEYQDTNRAQYELVKALAGRHRNIFAVGDPDQSIYAWRGADIRNILEFEKDWVDATIMRLEQNYRSSSNILNAANSVIKNNSMRYEKKLWSENPDGEPVKYAECSDEHAEARNVASVIKDGIRKNSFASYKDFAVFYRTNAQSRVLEERLMTESIPYAIVGGMKFYERSEVKDAISYLRVLVNPKDSLSLRRIINTPARGVGSVTLNEIESIAKTLNITLFDAFKEGIQRGALKKPAQAGLFEAFERSREELNKDEKPIHEIAIKLLEETGYIGMWKEENTEDASNRLENIHEFISAIKDYETRSLTPSLGEFLELVSLATAVDNYEDKTNRVTLMTLHSAKGLEFKTVFLTGLEEGLFPHQRSTGSLAELEEERRLFYVGMTRAKERLYLYSARVRTIFGMERFQTRSRFVDEISDEFIEKTSVGISASRTEKSETGCPRPMLRMGTPGWAGSRWNSEPRYEPCEDGYYATPEMLEKPSKPEIDAPYYSMDAGSSELSGANWKIGMKVAHPNFGSGVIKAKEGNGEAVKLTVVFPSAGQKKLIAKYANLVPVLADGTMNK